MRRSYPPLLINWHAPSGRWALWTERGLPHTEGWSRHREAFVGPELAFDVAVECVERRRVNAGDCLGFLRVPVPSEWEQTPNGAIVRAA